MHSRLFRREPPETCEHHVVTEREPLLEMRTVSSKDSGSTHYSKMFLVIQFQGTTTAASRLDALYRMVRKANQEEVETAYECEAAPIEDVRVGTNVECAC